MAEKALLLRPICDKCMSSKGPSAEHMGEGDTWHVKVSTA